MRSSARLTEGFTITLENLPGLWAEDAGVVQTPDELHLDPIAPPRTPRRFVVKIQTGQQPVVLDLIFEPCTLDGSAHRMGRADRRAEGRVRCATAAA